MTEQDSGRRKLHAPDLRARKGTDKIVMLSAYDYHIARLAELAGIDLLLVGDSLGMVVLGMEGTTTVTLEEILHHTRAVARGAPNTHVIADLPFGSYQVSNAQAIESSVRLIKEGNADSVKLEGGRVVVDRVRALVAAGIPVAGHIGLTPQSAGSQGGLKVQGGDLESAQGILADAEAIAEAGVFCIVIEAVPADLAALITERVPVPTIGIGAGPSCDGQVLVSPDLLGLEDRLTPKFTNPYVDLTTIIKDAFSAYGADVRQGRFPTPDLSHPMHPEIVAALRKLS
ncbi:MAG: 3-methyl-2-oxobutanoate hydroxymethyltransferase [Chloroflexota bacterium]|nr:3-methyl-2-oxobutanoate hydroxymethyltransferase [Chloroflexota bacterium]